MAIFTSEAKAYIRSRKFRNIVLVIAGVLSAIAIFQAGVLVGFHKARFSFDLGDNFHRVFGEHGPGGFGDGMMGGFSVTMMRDGGFSNAYGAAGKIVSIALPMMVVAGQDGVEKTIVMNSATAIREFRDTIASSSLKVGDTIVVFGNPNASAQIEATLIRILPPVLGQATTTAR